MNYKHIAIIALVLMLACIVPASAVWSNGNWVADDKKDEYFGNAEVKYDPTTGVTSKYSAPEDINLMTYQGMVIGHLRSGGVLDGGARFLFHRVGTDENQTLAQSFGPDGQYTGYLTPGEYDVILPQGTGSACGIYSDDWGYVGNPHEERTTITVVAGQKAYFDFIGNSIPSTRGDPKSASINAYLGNGDIRLEWIKLVKTGEHQYTPPCYYITVIDVPAWEETVTDSPAHTEYRYERHYQIVDWKYTGGQWKVKCTNHAEHGNGWHYQTSDCTSEYHTEWSDARNPVYDRIGEETRNVPAVTHTVTHPAITHQQQVCPGSVTIPEYGLEYFLEIGRYHADITNPNFDPVNVEFSFDLNYFIDRRPWDNVVDDGRIVPRVKTVSGEVQIIGSGTTKYHGVITPDVDNAVAVFDWQHGIQYIPTIENARVTSTQWL